MAGGVQAHAAGRAEDRPPSPHLRFKSRSVNYVWLTFSIFSVSAVRRKLFFTAPRRMNAKLASVRSVEHTPYWKVTESRSRCRHDGAWRADLRGSEHVCMQLRDGGSRIRLASTNRLLVLRLEILQKRCQLRRAQRGRVARKASTKVRSETLARRARRWRRWHALAVDGDCTAHGTGTGGSCARRR